MQIKKINYDNKSLNLKIANYSNNDRVYLGLYDDDGYYADITINLPDYLLYKKNQAFLNGDLESNHELVKILENSEVIRKTGIRVPYNLGEYEMIELNFEKIKEYDPLGLVKTNIDEDINIRI